MQGVIKRATSCLFALMLVCNFALAIDNEYKNSLLKIELSKKDTNTYNIDLTTQKKYSEPVKVIKKNDLSYYILLPETKNSISGQAAASQDIKNITTSSYNYANQDKNGYTKININTAKPVNFNISVKSLSQARASQNKISAANSSPAKSAQSQVSGQKSGTQKKNLSSAGSSPKSIVLPSSAAPAAQAASLNNKEVKKQTAKTQTKQAAKQEKPAKKAKQINQANNKPAAQKPKMQPAPVLEVEQKEFAPQKEIKDEVEQIDTRPIEEAQEEAPGDEINETGGAVEIENTETKSETLSRKDLIFKKLSSAAHKIKNKLKTVSGNISYKTAAKYLILALIIFLAASLLMAAILAAYLNRKIRTRIKESLGLSGYRKIREEEHETPQKSNDGQYFVFDKNISQNFYNPNNSKKHYELSSYDPDIQINYGKKALEKKQNKKYYKQIEKEENEYDIIQKILKEDSLIEFEPDELNKIEKAPAVAPEQIRKKAEKPKVQQPVVQKVQSQPVVLSSVEIAPERGFMCVSYNDSINLLGYIFDDVYALYNFKQPKLENYDIKFRLSDKDDKGANFIVRVDNSKMLIRVTKSFMTLEVLM